MPFAAGLATLMESTPLPGQVAQVAAGIDPKLRSIAVRQAEAALDRKGPEFDLLEPPAAAGAALALAIRFDDLEGCGLLDLAARRRLHALRRGAEEACRDSFLASVERQVLAPLAALIEAPEVADEMRRGHRGGGPRPGAAGMRRAPARRAAAGGGSAYDRARRAIAEALRLLAGRALSPAGLRPHGPGARRRDPVRNRGSRGAARQRRRAASPPPPATLSRSPPPARPRDRRCPRGSGGWRRRRRPASLPASNTSVRAKNTFRPALTTRPSAESRVPIAACPVKRQSRSSVTARRTRRGIGAEQPGEGRGLVDHGQHHAAMDDAGAVGVRLGGVADEPRIAVAPLGDLDAEMGVVGRMGVREGGRGVHAACLPARRLRVKPSGVSRLSSLSTRPRVGHFPKGTQGFTR